MQSKLLVSKGTLCAGVVFAVCFLFAACAEDIKSPTKAPEGKTADLGEVTIEPANMALFVDDGERRLTAIFPEAAAVAQVEWSVSDPAIAEIQANGETVVVVPKSAGNTTVVAKLVPRQAGTALNIKNPEAICPITVVSEFKLDNQRLLFFENESTQSLAAIIPQSVLEVAKIVWSVETERAGSIAVTGDGLTVSVAASGQEPLGVITAKLEAKDVEAFNGTGRSAVCVVTSLEAPHIETPAASYILNAESSERTSLITAQYGPVSIDIWKPQVTWTSKTPAVARFEGTGSASLGLATTHIVAASVGTAEVEAELEIAGRRIKNVNQVQVGPYQNPSVPATAISISPQPSSVTKTDQTELITATLSRPDGAELSDPVVEWDVSETGVVEILASEAAPNNTQVRLLGVWNGEGSKIVTVTARSRSTTSVQASFNITVGSIVVSVTAAPGSSTSLTKGGSILLNTDTNVQNKNIKNWSSNQPDIVKITANGDGNTNAAVEVKDVAAVTSGTAVEIYAYAAADDGATSGKIEIAINPHTFKIKYNKNGGTGPDAAADDYTYGDGTKNFTIISALGWSKEDHIFAGWTLVEDNEAVTDTLSDGASITVLNGNTTAKTPGETVDLYAKWECYKFLATIHNADTWKTALGLITANGGGTAQKPKQYIFTVTGNFSIPQTGTAGNPSITASCIYVSLTAAGAQEITLSAPGHLLELSAHQKMEITNITLIGINPNNSSLVYINGAELVMDGRTSILGNNIPEHGAAGPAGGVSIVRGTLTMKGSSSIQDNTGWNGGGVFATGGAISLQDDSKIETNSAQDGGGINCDIFVNMSGNARIYNNIAANKGGGIYGGVIMRDSAYIGVNYARWGGGVYSPGTLYAAELRGFTRSIRMYDTSKITANKAEKAVPNSPDEGHGAGLYLENTDLYMFEYASVSGNFAHGNGGGIYLMFNEDSNNSAPFALSSIVIMNDSAMIDRNETVMEGGGIYIFGSSTGQERCWGLGMGGGSIQDNKADTYRDSAQIKNQAGIAKYGPFYTTFGELRPEAQQLLEGNDIIPAGNGNQISQNIRVIGDRIHYEAE